MLHKSPEINISDIVEEFYNKEVINGMPAQSPKQIFRKTLKNDLERIMHGSRWSERRATPASNDTSSMFITSQPPVQHPRVSIADADEVYQPSKRVFTLNKYSLRDIQDAYHAYIKARRSVETNYKHFYRYVKDKEK